MIKYFVLLVFLQSCFITKSYSNSIIRRLPGYAGDLPFKLETGYVRTGKKEDIQLFYCFIESTRNPKEDPLIFHLPGGPGASGILALLYETGPLTLNADNLTLTLNPYAWTQMANMIFLDAPAGAGFSYAETIEGWTSSDTILSTLCVEFIRKFLKDHPKFLRNPLYTSGISYSGIVIPKVTLDLFQGNERGDQPAINIQGYILCSPLTNKFDDFNSRLEYAHRMALISDDINMLAKTNCDGNYVDIQSANSACRYSLQYYEECISRINLQNILLPYCDESDPMLDCEIDVAISNKWANMEVVQQALNIRQGKVGKVEMINYTMHYLQGKNDTSYYSYDIFSSFSYHKELLSKSCRALIISGDHDLTFPYIGVEKWISFLNLEVEAPWKPFYVDDEVGGYVTKYAQNNYSLAFATVKGAGHSVAYYKPKESFAFAQMWFSSYTYSSDH
ncbi:serine carboxypeptidase-like 13 [Bidens hawaiensis]|uniref:serine carboxypeptidase-like 13 n=1 Tax=Bidens hawaiensis TaxID=980011 RepID=UPI0040496CD2